MSLNEHEFSMAITTLTQECTTSSHRNSRKTIRLALRHEKRPDSPALHAEQVHVPHQTCKETVFA